MKKIYISQFMAIQEAEIEINKALLLIGEQASGKSTIAKLIYFFKSLPQDLLYLIYENIDSTKNLEALFRQEVQNKFYNFFGSTRHLPDFQIKYFYSSDKYIELSLHPDKSLKFFLAKSLYQSTFYKDVPPLTQALKKFSSKKDIFELREFQAAVKKLERFINNLFEEPHTPLFIPAGRNITVNYPEQFKLDFYGNLRGDLARGENAATGFQSADLYLMIKFLEHTERVKDRFSRNDFSGLIEEKLTRGDEVDKALLLLASEKVGQILKGEYRQDQFGEKIFYNAQGYVNLDQASSGQQEAIRILQDIFLILLDKNSAFRVIEEPEAHLYPVAQKQLIEMVALMLNNSNSQVVITTHSPYILSIFNNLLFAVRVFSRNKSLSARINPIIPEACWLNPDEFSVYFLKDGCCKSIFDAQTGLIGQNYLDEISEALGDEFDALYTLYKNTFK